MEFFGYRKLVAYVRAKDIIKHIYILLRKFPKEENSALCNQLRRSSVSITSNIAEGLSRFSNKDKVHFLEISYGSLMEAMSQLEIARDLEYISEADLENMESLIAEEARLLSGLQNSFKDDTNSQKLKRL